MAVVAHTYVQATLTSSGIGGAALVSVSNTAAVTAVAPGVLYPSAALFPSGSLTPGGIYLPAGPTDATLAPQAIAAAAIQYT